MIITEYYMKCKNGIELYRTYSDKGYYIIQMPTEIKYIDAVDTLDAPYTYVETDELIPTESEEEVGNDGNNDETWQS